MCEDSKLHAYLEGGDREVLRYQYHPLWYQVPYQKYQVIPLLTISRHEAPRKFFQLVPKFSKWYPILPYLKHVPIKYIYFERGRFSISCKQFQSLNLPSSWILLLNFGNYVANKHDLVPVSPGLATVPLLLVLVSPMYVPGTTDQVPRYHNPVTSIWLSRGFV